MKFLVCILVLGILCVTALAQPGAINFHKVSFNEGLHDGVVRSIAQDKYGYIWVATTGALNRYNGNKITRFTNIPGDTTSPYRTQPRSLHSDSEGRLWIGSESGLMEYIFKTGKFRRIASLENKFILSISTVSDSILMLTTRNELIRFNKRLNTWASLGKSLDKKLAVLRRRRFIDIYPIEDKLLLGTDSGLIIYNCINESASRVDLPNTSDMFVISVSSDDYKNIWLAGRNPKLVRIDSGLHTAHVLDSLLPGDLPNNDIDLIGITADPQLSLWIVTPGSGLIQHDIRSGTFKSHLFSSHLQTGPPTNDYRYIFQDAKGIIWLGCHVDGISYFAPGETLFATILPFPNHLQESLSKAGRAIGEDRNGLLWLGNHDGLSCYDKRTGKYRVWRNEPNAKLMLYSNTVRTLLCDSNFVWIGTEKGVNRFNLLTQQMEFVSEKDLPLSFYNSINKDSSGNIWFCTNDSASLYWYNNHDKEYKSIFQHPVLKNYTRQTPASYLLEDSRRRLWISTARRGVLMYDKITGNVQRFQAAEVEGQGLLGNQVVDIKEDRNGWIWIASFNGLTGIDPALKQIKWYSKKNGLAGSMVSSVAVDNANRLWIGSNGGLSMLDNDRKTLVTFSSGDGLPSVGFPEHAAVTIAHGEIVFPTYSGYLMIKPERFREKQNKFPFYVSGYTVSNKETVSITEMDAPNNIRFKAAQNSFTLHLDALNYANPAQTWFAYKLEGFDKDWQVTQDNKVVYTNVPGGDYHFLYKASSNNANWSSISEKSINVSVANYFYKTVWFKLLLGALIVLSTIFFFRYRSGQQHQVYRLKEKAQALEKEKAQVTYENLKQQLNPHFLFNSLTSLSSLINTNPKTAGEFLSSLSKTYRYILKSRDTELVALGDEIQFAQHYVSLQQTRFEKGLEVFFDIPVEHHHQKIVPVTLQNLVENAIKHNIIDEESPLRICIKAKDNKLSVTNNLQRKKMVETSNKTGLQSLQSLYQYLSSEPVLIIETDKKFTVEIPLL